ncbi:FMN-binding negative transcriptional regulator [Pseudomonas sp. Marseille-QA0892]
MYIPKPFRQADKAQLIRHIHLSRLATVVSVSPEGLIATHLPLVFDEQAGPHGTLYGHLARANPHWRGVVATQETLIIFQGPDAYITPSWYAAKAEHGKVVPTWNYTAVHAYGQPEVFDDATRLRDVITRLTEKHEASQKTPWSVSDAPRDYIDGMLRAIVGIAIPLTRMEGKWKLSQNRPEADIEGVRVGLTASDNPADHALLNVMQPR